MLELEVVEEDLGGEEAVVSSSLRDIGVAVAHPDAEAVMEPSAAAAVDNAATLDPSVIPRPRSVSTAGHSETTSTSGQSTVVKSKPHYSEDLSHPEIVNRGSGRVQRLSSMRSAIGVISSPIVALLSLFRKDWFHSVVNCKWSTLLITYGCIYISFWLVFSLLYYPLTTIDGCPEETNLYDWEDCFTLSIMIASTIGFGNVDIEPRCTAYAYVVLVLQILLSLVLDNLFMGIIFVKISRPETRGKCIFFSDTAVIVREPSGTEQLQIRIADSRRNQLVEAHIRLLIYEKIRDPQTGGVEIKVSSLEVDEEQVFLAVPHTVRHDISEDSPLHKLLHDHENERFEMVLLIEGSEPTTSLTTQARHSYHCMDIHPGRTFAPMLFQNSANTAYEVDFSKISSLSPRTGSSSEKELESKWTTLGAPPKVAELTQPETDFRRRAVSISSVLATK